MEKRDSKDPMPTALNTKREKGDGNTPATGEEHNARKAEHVTPESRFTIRKGGETQPTRQGGGNTPVTGETHNSKKAEHVTPESRF